jgi:sarcosine oxidase subunit alpha
VGIRTVDRNAKLAGGMHFVPQQAKASIENAQGHVTSVCYSPTLGQWIGIGLLTNGPERHGETVRVVDPLRGAETLVEVCSPVFIDPEGARLRG